MTDRRIKTFAKTGAGLLGHACAFRALSGDEVIVAASTPGALGRVCETMGFRAMDLGRTKRVAISEFGASGTPLTRFVDRIKGAYRDAVESAAHPASKPHREAIRAFQKHTDALAAAAAQLEQEAASRWTPVTEKMPDDDALVLLALNDDEAWPGYRDGDTWRYVDSMPITGERVTHWMPMPAVPFRGAA